MRSPRLWKTISPGCSSRPPHRIGPLECAADVIKNAVRRQREIGHPWPLLPAADQAELGQLDISLMRLEIAGDGQDHFDTCPAQTTPEIVGIAKGECATLCQLLAPLRT